MKAENREEVARAPSGRAASKARARLATALSSARDWGWGAVAGKVLLAGLGLLLLGAVGRSALAHSILSTDMVPAIDAALPGLPGLAAVAPLLPAPAATAPPPAAIAAPTATQAVALPDAAAVGPPGTPSASARGRATPDDPVYLNQATVTDLRRLPGVGAKRADAILALRARLGHFRQIEDLLKVKGVGRSSLRKLRPLVRLDPPPARVADGGVGDAGSL